MIAKKVVIALSGGVDSSVGAYLLKNQGYDVIALFMKNWYNTEFLLHDKCPWIEDSNDALLVSKKLDIPFHIIDLSKEYKNCVVNYMFKEYKNGKTPNPDIICNRDIKFNIFLKIALSLGADYIATGHYARIKIVYDNEASIVYKLFTAKDENKDQSYFLSQLNQYQLSKSLFPIGNLYKKEVRLIANKLGLVTAKKKDSQGLCFVGKISLPIFLQQELKIKKGKIIEISSNYSLYHKNIPKFSNLLDQLIYESTNYFYDNSQGKIIGEHIGAHFFTKGQRKGIKIGGRQKPLFVIGIDIKNNFLYVGEGNLHPGLFKQTIFIPFKESHWIDEKLKLKNNELLKVYARIRYRQKLKFAILYKTEIGYFLRFNRKISGISEGQFAVCYIHNELIFSGIIN